MLTKIYNPLNLITDLLNEYESLPNQNYTKNFLPPVDLIDSEKNYEIHLAVAGFEKTDIKIKIENNILIISGEKKKIDKKYYIKENIYDKFIRKFTLPKEIIIENITAKYNNGILEIKIDKDLNSKINKTIEIE